MWLDSRFSGWRLFHFPASAQGFSWARSSCWRWRWWLWLQWQWWWWWWRWLWSAVVVNKHLVATGALGDALGGGRWARWAWCLWYLSLLWLMLQGWKGGGDLMKLITIITIPIERCTTDFYQHSTRLLASPTLPSISDCLIPYWYSKLQAIRLQTRQIKCTKRYILKLRLWN